MSEPDMHLLPPEPTRYRLIHCGKTLRRRSGWLFAGTCVVVRLWQWGGIVNRKVTILFIVLGLCATVMGQWFPKCSMLLLVDARPAWTEHR